MSRPTLAAVAAIAGVSTQTVSNAISSPHRLSPPTLLRVRSAIAQLEYVPNHAARALRGTTTRSVVIGTIDLSCPLTRSVVTAIDDACWSSGLRSFVVPHLDSGWQGQGFQRSSDQVAGAIEIVRGPVRIEASSTSASRPRVQVAVPASTAIDVNLPTEEDARWIGRLATSLLLATMSGRAEALRGVEGPVPGSA